MNVLRKPRETKPLRMSALARLPVFLALEGKRAVVAGATPAAAWKAELLSAAGANVDVYAIDVSDEMLQLVADPPRQFRSDRSAADRCRSRRLPRG